ncbi:MAG: citrate lyase acyl carrier protein, partial [Candidatus Neomarinimicrobiota bacterium]
MSKIGIAGNCGKEDRSDCQITLELTDSGGIQIELTSKVKTLYGKSIEAECRKVLDFFGIGNALVKINDNGALPFTLAARLEAAIKQVTKTTKEFL